MPVIHFLYEKGSACGKCFDLRRLSKDADETTCKLCIKWMDR